MAQPLRRGALSQASAGQGPRSQRSPLPCVHGECVRGSPGSPLKEPLNLGLAAQEGKAALRSQVSSPSLPLHSIPFFLPGPQVTLAGVLEDIPLEEK